MFSIIPNLSGRVGVLDLNLMEAKLDDQYHGSVGSEDQIGSNQVWFGKLLDF